MKGDVLERKYDGRAVKVEGGLYYCLHINAINKQPCKNLTRWSYRPYNSDVCLFHIHKIEGSH